MSAYDLQNMTITEAVAELDALHDSGGDQQRLHITADNILIGQLKKLGHWPRELAEAYERADERIHFLHA
jgi:hypothetical protein